VVSVQALGASFASVGRRVLLIMTVGSLAAGLLPLALPTSAAASPGAAVIFDNTPSTIPPNLASQPFEAQQVTQYGAEVAFAPGGRGLSAVTVTMSTWARRSDWLSWPLTASGGWAHPITLNLYAVNTINPTVPGPLIRSTTQTFSIPWRPASDPACPNTGYGAGFGWRASDGACYNGYAFNISFDISSLGVVVPDQAVIGIAYDTSDYGAAPLRTANPDGGPYDSLNVATYPGTGAVTPATVGQFLPDSSTAFFASGYGPFYCDGGSSGTGVFRLDVGCWGGYEPAIQVTAQTPCVSVCYVDAAGGNDGLGGGAPAQAKRTIAAAIAQVEAGGTIIIAPGTYTESLDIPKGLALRGPNAGVNPNTGSRSAEAVIAGGASTTIRLSTASDVVIDGLTFTGAQGPTIDSYTTGNRPTIQNDIFTGGADGFFLGNPASVTFRDNSLHDLADCASCEGLFIAGNWNGTTGTTVAISGNVWLNVAGVGMNLSNVSGSITGNTLSHVVYYGALLANSTNVDVTGNTFADITNPDPTVTTWGSGVRFYQPGPGFGARISNNTFSRNYVGVGVRMGSPTADVTGLDVQIHNNRFVGNGYGIRHDGLGTLDAICNWWNSVGGPQTSGADPVAGPVSYLPWNTSAAGSCNGLVAQSNAVAATGAMTADMLAIATRAKAGFEAANPGTTLQLTLGTTDTAIAALSAGTVPVAGISRPLTAAEQSGLYAWQVGSDAMVFAVQESPSMAFLTGLTSAQVRDIWSGALTSWSQLGGPGVAVVPRSLGLAADARSDLLRIFTIADLAEQATISGSGQSRLESSAQAASAAATNPYQIVYTSLAGAAQAGLRVLTLDGVTPSAQTVNSDAYPAVRRFFIAVPKFAGPVTSYTDLPAAVKSQDLVNYLLSTPGQIAVGAASFVGAPVPASQPIPDIDVDLNGGVGLTDIGQITGRWNTTNSSVSGWIRADVDNSGGVGLTDIGRITGHWGQAGFTPPS
jgi:ABC-type phosphate transport system substrate-binding protein/nitrous oxidase accessory protein NosD